MTLCCPACHGDLHIGEERAQCGTCGKGYPTIGPILDLRVPGPSWIDYEEDRRKARRLLGLGTEAPASALLEFVFRGRTGWSDEQVAYRTRQALEGVGRLESELEGWLQPCFTSRGPVLDLGCGAGQLVAAVMMAGSEIIGLDVSMEWLVVADRMVRERAGPPTLVAALAEALPFPDGSVSTVLSMDVVEHVGDQRAYLREINRVLAPGGCAAFTTPNRFSFAAEPHVGVWGVGWVPRRWQKRLVERRTHLSYDFVRLLGSFEIRRLMRRETELEVRIQIPPIPGEDLERFSPRRAALGRVYNALTATVLTRWLFFLIGPFFRVLGRKRASPAGFVEPPGTN